MIILIFGVAHTIKWTMQIQKLLIYHNTKKENKYETWKYFRDNYIYSYNDNLVNHATKGDFWRNLDNWDMYNINCFRTQKGTKYFNEILAPKFYNKYKDLEVEIDDKGNIIRWIGKINR